MHSVFSYGSAVHECFGAVRSFVDSGNRTQLLVFREEQNVPVCGTWGRDWNLRVGMPIVSHLSNDRATVADRRSFDFVPQLLPMRTFAHEDCCRNRPFLAAGGSMQTYKDFGFQFSGSAKECATTSAITRPERSYTDCSRRTHPSPRASWRSSEISQQRQLVSSRWAPGNKIPGGSQLSSKSTESLSLDFDGRRFSVSESSMSSGYSQGVRKKVGLPPKKFRGSFARSAILSRSPDTKPDEHHESDREADSQISVATTSEVPVSVDPEDVKPMILHGGGGKSGFVSFHRRCSDQQEPETTIATRRSWRSIFWLLGPLVLTTSVFLPPIYLRKIFGRVLTDSLMTDFVILIFTETLFFVGASVFLYIAHQFRSGVGSMSTSEERPTTSLPFGYRVSTIVSLGIGLFLPVATFSMVWPWTGPAAAAALAPYMVGLLVQLSLEQIARVNKSPAWPLVPITFQMYRLHQLNRAAQLISGLMFSLKGVEATAETMAISGSLQTLLFVLKILGVVCLGSLAAFLTHQLPTHPPASSSISSLP